MKYEEYLQICNNIEKQNLAYLNIFKEDLEKQNYAKETIEQHYFNAKFYLNEFLLRYQPLTMEQGCEEAHSFFTYFFVSNCGWASINNIKKFKTSLKKFYKCMVDHNLLPQEEYDYLCYIFKNYQHEFEEAYYNRYQYVENFEELN